MAKYEIKSENNEWESYPMKENDTNAWATLLRIGWTEITAKHKDGRIVAFREAPLCCHKDYKIIFYYVDKIQREQVLFVCSDCGKESYSSAEFHVPGA